MTVVLLVILAIVLAAVAGVGWGALWGWSARTAADEPRDRLSRGLADMAQLHEAALSEVASPAIAPVHRVAS